MQCCPTNLFLDDKSAADWPPPRADMPEQVIFHPANMSGRHVFAAHDGGEGHGIAMVVERCPNPIVLLRVFQHVAFKHDVGGSISSC